jgi:hypothetical protein
LGEENSAITTSNCPSVQPLENVAEKLENVAKPKEKKGSEERPKWGVR